MSAGSVLGIRRGLGGNASVSTGWCSTCTLSYGISLFCFPCLLSTVYLPMERDVSSWIPAVVSNQLQEQTVKFFCAAWS